MKYAPISAERAIRETMIDSLSNIEPGSLSHVSNCESIKRVNKSRTMRQYMNRARACHILKAESIENSRKPVIDCILAKLNRNAESDSTYRKYISNLSRIVFKPRFKQTLFQTAFVLNRVYIQTSGYVNIKIYKYSNI